MQLAGKSSTHIRHSRLEKRLSACGLASAAWPRCWQHAMQLMHCSRPAAPCRMAQKAGTGTCFPFKQRLRSAQTPVQCGVEELEGNALEGLSYLTPSEAAQVLDQFRDADPRTVRNKGARPHRAICPYLGGAGRVHGYTSGAKARRCGVVRPARFHHTTTAAILLTMDRQRSLGQVLHSNTQRS